jgi:hypothetical protein
MTEQPAIELNPEVEIFQGDILAVRGRGWLSDGIAKAEYGSDEPLYGVTHVGLFIAPGNDTSIAVDIEALRRVKTNILRVSTYEVAHAYVLHDLSLTDLQRSVILQEACTFSAADYGYIDLGAQWMDATFKTSWWTNRLTGYLARRPICLPGDTRVMAIGIKAISRRPYKGDVVEISIPSGDNLTLTPEHPVLTPHGWVLADALEEGQEVFFGGEAPLPMLATDPEDRHMPTRIEDIFNSANESSRRTSSGGAENFDSDVLVGQSDVDIKRPARLLINNLRSRNADNRSAYSALAQGGASIPLDGLGATTQFDERLLFSDQRAMRVRGDGASVFLSRIGVSEFARSLKVSEREAMTPQIRLDVPGVHPIFASERYRALAARILPVKLSRVRRKFFSGQVYNLHTADELYHAGGFVVHNCSYVVSAAYAAIRLDFGVENSGCKPSDIMAFALEHPEIYRATQIK